jgi:Tol biopolymer transport system component
MELKVGVAVCLSTLVWFFGGLMSVVSRSLLGGLLVSFGAAIYLPAHAGPVRFDGDGHVYHPVFSLDGKYVAYEVNRLTQQVDLYVSKVNGSIADDGMHVSLPGGGAFSGGDVVAANPVWHPDGLIVFEGSNQGGQYRLYYQVPGNGTAAEMITTQEVAGHITFPTVAQDGSKMALIAKKTGNGDVYTRDTNSGKLAQETESNGTESFPTFSPDAKEIMFTRKHADTEDIFVKRFSDGMEKMVTGGPGDQSRPAYAVAGGRVLYFDGSRGESQWDLMSVDNNGGGGKRLGKGVRLPHRARPAVSKDGEWVAFTSDDPQQGSKVSIVKVDGSQTVTINTEHTACGEPSLSENNGRIILAYTALPNSGAEWRFLTILDVTDKL